MCARLEGKVRSCDCTVGILTSSSAVAERSRDVLCPSVVSFSSVIPRAQSIVIFISDSVHLPLHTIKCCSVVFGVSLKLLVINILSSSPAINKLRRLPATSAMNSPLSVAAEYIALGGRNVHTTRWSHRDFAYPTCIRRPR